MANELTAAEWDAIGRAVDPLWDEQADWYRRVWPTWAGRNAGIAYRLGRMQAAADIRKHAEATGWYEGGGVWAAAIEIAEGAAKRAEGGEPNA